MKASQPSKFHLSSTVRQSARVVTTNQNTTPKNSNLQKRIPITVAPSVNPPLSSSLSQKQLEKLHLKQDKAYSETIDPKKVALQIKQDNAQLKPVVGMVHRLPYRKANYQSNKAIGNTSGIGVVGDTYEKVSSLNEGRQAKISNTASSQRKHKLSGQNSLNKQYFRKNFLSSQFDGVNRPLDFFEHSLIKNDHGASSHLSRQSNLHRKHLSLEKAALFETNRVDFRKFNQETKKAVKSKGSSDEEHIQSNHEYYERSNTKKRQTAVIKKLPKFALNLDGIEKGGSEDRQQMIDSQRSRKSESSQQYVDDEIKRIHLDAQRKERNLVEQFDKLKYLAKDALFCNLNQTGGTQQQHQEFDRRMQRFETIVSVLMNKPIIQEEDSELGASHQYDGKFLRAEDASQGSLESHKNLRLPQASQIEQKRTAEAPPFTSTNYRSTTTASNGGGSFTSQQYFSSANLKAKPKLTIQEPLLLKNQPQPILTPQNPTRKVNTFKKFPTIQIQSASRQPKVNESHSLQDHRPVITNQSLDSQLDRPLSAADVGQQNYPIIQSSTNKVQNFIKTLQVLEDCRHVEQLDQEKLFEVRDRLNSYCEEIKCQKAPQESQDKILKALQTIIRKLDHHQSSFVTEESRLNTKNSEYQTHRYDKTAQNMVLHNLKQEKQAGAGIQSINQGQNYPQQNLHFKMDNNVKNPDLLLVSPSSSSIAYTDDIFNRQNNTSDPVRIGTPSNREILDQEPTSNTSWAQDVQDIKTILHGSVTDSCHMVPLPTKDKKSLLDLMQLGGPSSIRMMTKPAIFGNNMVSRNVLGHGIADKKALSEPQQVKRFIKDYQQQKAAQLKHDEDNKQSCIIM